MPQICFHLSIAREAAARLDHPVIEHNLGNFLLGSTLPDVHIMTRVPRQKTHFFNLEIEDNEKSVIVFLRSYPELANGASLDGITSAMVSGYLSHLITDEVWIIDIYRPFFGPSSPLATDPMANILDRVLQYELGIRERLDKDNMNAIKSELAYAKLGAGLGFIDEPTLRRWREVVIGFMERELDWSTFPLFARRYLPSQEMDQNEAERLVTSIPLMLERAMEQVTTRGIEGFKERSIAESVAAVGEYLS